MFDTTPGIHPFATLTPDVVLDALASVGWMGDGRLLALSSYENRVYRAMLDTPEADGLAAVVVKFYRPERWTEAQILEEHQFAAELLAAEVPLVAPLPRAGQTLFHHAGFAFSVAPARGGRMPELDDPAVLEWIGRLLARLHTVGASRRFAQRPALDLLGFGRQARQAVLDSGHLPLDVASRWLAAADRVLDRLADPACGVRPEAVAAAGSRCHGDNHPGNILWTPDQGPHFVDLDDARTTWPVQDLWMLCSGSRAQQQAQLGALLDGYEQVRDFDRRQLAFIEPLRTLRLLHYSAWLAQRWSDPMFPLSFPWFGRSDYWLGQVQMLEDQLEALDQSPLVA